MEYIDVIMYTYTYVEVLWKLLLDTMEKSKASLYNVYCRLQGISYGVKYLFKKLWGIVISKTKSVTLETLETSFVGNVHDKQN